jgi:hypothetical protein
MSPRAIRRAAERQTLKLAAQIGKAKTMLAQPAPTGSPETMLAKQAPTGSPETMLAKQTPTGSPETMLAGPDQPPMTLGLADLIAEIKQTSEARLLANRANAQRSTGPTSAEGKAKSSLNAVKTGLTGRTVLLPADDAIVYRQHLDRNFSKFSPATDDEHILVQTIADTEWRLLRIAPLEAATYALGHRKLAGQFADETDTPNREALIMAEVFAVYLRQFSNLALQERRLRNQRQADIAELQQLQKDRIEKAERAAKALTDKRCREIERACKLSNNAAIHKLDLDFSEHGFDFSLAELHAYCKQNDAQRRLTESDLDFDRWLASSRAFQKEPKAA